MKNDPFAKLGALDQKLYQKPSDLVKETTQKENSSSPPKPHIESKPDERTHTRIDASLEVDRAESLYRKLQHKHHLSSYTFRYRLEELEALKKLDEKLEKGHPNKLSKNDLVRLGVNWLLEDYERNGESSMLARILARM